MIFRAAPSLNRTAACSVRSTELPPRTTSAVAPHLSAVDGQQLLRKEQARDEKAGETGGHDRRQSPAEEAEPAHQDSDGSSFSSRCRTRTAGFPR